ncbi:MAG: hypothetical protein AAF288_03650 [Planctomycetota bacterium]
MDPSPPQRDAPPPNPTDPPKPTGRPRPSLTGYVIALGLAAASLGGFWATVMAEDRKAQTLIDATVRFVAPGQAEFDAPEPGRYLVYHLFAGEFDGRSYAADPRTVWPFREIVALRVEASTTDEAGQAVTVPTAPLVGDKTDQEIADRKGGPEPHNWAVQVRRPGFEASAVYRIDVDTPGRYRVNATWRTDLVPPVYTDPAAYQAELDRRAQAAQDAGKAVPEMGFEPIYLAPLEPEAPEVLLAVGPDIAGDRFHRVIGLRGAGALAGIGLTAAGVLGAITFARRAQAKVVERALGRVRPS